MIVLIDGMKLPLVDTTSTLDITSFFSPGLFDIRTYNSRPVRGLVKWLGTLTLTTKEYSMDARKGTFSSERDLFRSFESSLSSHSSK